MLNKIFYWFTKFLVVWVLVASFLGYFFPNFFILLKPYTELLFAFTMFGIGCILTKNDFLPIFKKPQIVFLGTLSQFLIMPTTGFLLAKLFKLQKELFLGTVLVGSVPGAMASNVISYLAKADVAYSVALTTTSTFLSPLLTPTFVYLFAHSIIEIKFFQMFVSIIRMVIVPVLVGMLFKHFFGKKLEKINNIFSFISTIFITFICGLVVALNRDFLKEASLVIFIVVFLHNLIGLIFGYIFAIIYKFDIKKKRTLSIEVGMQNAGLGAVLALKHFNAQSAIPNAIFTIWCIITASILAKIWGWKK
ncbi:MAG: bile acid:sodium symporter family protein [Candidatus Omnitrophica bacterium]|nr:bile acid:sodium symporter family protein [Candidatus Omnitrophota bacterium]